MKKIFSIILLTSLIVTLVGCSGETVAQTTPATQTEPVVQEPAPDPEPVEVVVEEPTPDPEPVEVVVEEPTPEPTPEPTEADIVAEVLASNEYQEDGIFCPKLYAESLGYKDWGGDYSIVIDGIEYFVWFEDNMSCFTIAYTDGERCYRSDVIDKKEADRDNLMDLKKGDSTYSHSRSYIEAFVARLGRLVSGDTTMENWTADGLSYGYFQYDSSPAFFDDGYIDASKFANKNEEKSFIILYE